MHLNAVDWIIIIAFLAISLLIGFVVYRKAGNTTAEYFLSGRSMPWWMLGVSMVATTFAADTPNLIADIVRKNGVSGNWVWWSFLLTGMMTVFIYAKLWRRSGVLTDLEFYEIRYSGKEAAFLRGFRAVYLGFFFNVVIMASVSLAAIKIGGALLNISPVKVVIIASVITVIYSSIGGFKGVLFTDFFQFFVAMTGSVLVTWYVLNLPQIGGLNGLLTHENVVEKINIWPDFSNTDMLIPVFIIPLTIQWWSVWYPGAEPGGGGYVAQRMLSAKNEHHAVWATLLFNVMHYAIRPWPWILVALASMVVFPKVADMSTLFPHMESSIVQDDLSYLAMLTFLPNGLIGLVLASLIAAYMSTISTHLNWGSSYLVNDFYSRFINKNASSTHLVNIGRICTVLLMFFAAFLALFLQSAFQVFNIMLQVGAGTGLLFILRWFWYRINAWSEITAMLVSFLMAVYLQVVHPLISVHEFSSSSQLLISLSITTIAWVSVTFLTKPSDDKVLLTFCSRINPGGPGWKKVYNKMTKDNNTVLCTKQDWDMPIAILCVITSSVMIISAICSIGYWIYGNSLIGTFCVFLFLLCALILSFLWKRLNIN